MKKIIYSLALIFTLTACSMNDVISLLVTPTVPPPPPPADETLEPTVFYTPSPTPTGTQVPTFTSTPTLVGGGEPLDAPTDGPEALPTLILVPTATSGPQISLFSDPGSLIISISVSSDTLFWGYCDAPKYLDFDVRLANNLRVGYVLLFLRLVDKGGTQSTAWGAGAIMTEVSGTNYTYHVTHESLTHYNQFRDAWIEYQVVVSTGGLRILESSPVYERSLSLLRCLSIEVDE
jgi:hypothetical protein